MSKGNGTMENANEGLLAMAIDRCVECMSDDKRRYHTVWHVRRMLSELNDRQDEFLLNPHEIMLVRMAVLYHDIVYVPGASDNEERSAKQFMLEMAPLMEPADAARVRDLILSTRINLESRPTDFLERVVRTLDWSGFCDWDTFVGNYARIRRESLEAGISEAEVIYGTLKFYGGLSEAFEQGFEADCFDPVRNAMAMVNVERFLNESAAGGFAREDGDEEE